MGFSVETSELDWGSQLQFDFVGELAKFDNVRFCSMCREVRVRLVHRDTEAAVRLLRAFAGETHRCLATMNSNIPDVFPVRTANYLESGGYEKLRAVDGALDAELLSIPGVGEVTVREIRDTIQRIKDGFAFEFEHESDLIDPEFTNTDEELKQYRPRLSMSNATIAAHANGLSPILQAINTLTANPEETLRTVDERIVKLEDELAKARSLRRLLEKTINIDKPKPVKADKEPSEKWIALEQAVYEAVMRHNGSAGCAVIAGELHILPLQVGKAVANSKRMRKRGKFVEAL